MAMRAQALCPLLRSLPVSLCFFTTRTQVVVPNPEFSKNSTYLLCFSVQMVFRGVRLAGLCSGTVQGSSERENGLQAASVRPHRGAICSPSEQKAYTLVTPKARRIRLCYFCGSSGLSVSALPASARASSQSPACKPCCQGRSRCSGQRILTPSHACPISQSRTCTTLIPS